MRTSDLVMLFEASRFAASWQVSPAKLHFQADVKRPHIERKTFDTGSCRRYDLGIPIHRPLSGIFHIHCCWSKNKRFRSYQPFLGGIHHKQMDVFSHGCEGNLHRRFGSGTPAQQSCSHWAMIKNDQADGYRDMTSHFFSIVNGSLGSQFLMIMDINDKWI